jgi:hypothetical protein
MRDQKTNAGRVEKKNKGILYVTLEWDVGARRGKTTADIKTMR